MKNRLITILITVLSVSVYGQNRDSLFLSDMTEGILQMRQMPGTEKLLKEYLSEVELEKDTVYKS